jgi:hypothetical protein
MTDTLDPGDIVVNERGRWLVVGTRRHRGGFSAVCARETLVGRRQTFDVESLELVDTASPATLELAGSLICTEVGCVALGELRGLCARHYHVAKRHGRLPEQRKTQVRLVCAWRSCSKDFWVAPHAAQGQRPRRYCSKRCVELATAALNLQRVNAERALRFNPDGTFTCRTCGLSLQPTAFYASKTSPTGRESRRIECERTRKSIYSRAHPQKQRRRRSARRSESNAYWVEWNRAREKSDVEYRILRRLRSHANRSLKRAGASKHNRFNHLLGCTGAVLREHIEARFQVGMTWDNHGTHGWHFDHVRPLASFDLTDPEQQLAAFNYRNLQPLWAADNLKKGDKWEE